MRPIFILLLFISCMVPSWAKEITFLVNEENPIQKLTHFEISQMYLKKTRNWSDGTTIRFFDRLDDSPERETFLKSVMKRSSRDIDQFWIGQKLYTGNSAPVQISTDKMTTSMVARFKGAIGYVLTENFQATKGIKKIEVSGSPTP